MIIFYNIDRIRSTFKSTYQKYYQHYRRWVLASGPLPWTWHVSVQFQQQFTVLYGFISFYLIPRDFSYYILIITAFSSRESIAASPSILRGTILSTRRRLTALSQRDPQPTEPCGNSIEVTADRLYKKHGPHFSCLSFPMHLLLSFFDWQNARLIASSALYLPVPTPLDF